MTATATDANGNAVNLAVRQLTAGERQQCLVAVAAKFGSNVDIMGAGDYHADGASESSPVTVTFNASVNAGDMYAFSISMQMATGMLRMQLQQTAQ